MILLAVLLTFAMSSDVASTTVTDSRVIFYDIRTNQSILPPLVTHQKQSAQLKSLHYQHGCECQGSNCGCCVEVRIPVINRDEKICGNASLNNVNKEWELTIYINEKSVATYKLSTEKPLCVPRTNHENVCLVVREISMDSGTLHLCWDLVLEIKKNFFPLNFPCVDLLPKNIHFNLDH